MKALINEISFVSSKIKLGLKTWKLLVYDSHKFKQLRLKILVSNTTFNESTKYNNNK